MLASFFPCFAGDGVAATLRALGRAADEKCNTIERIAMNDQLYLFEDLAIDFAGEAGDFGGEAGG